MFRLDDRTLGPPAASAALKAFIHRARTPQFGGAFRISAGGFFVYESRPPRASYRRGGVCRSPVDGWFSPAGWYALDHRIQILSAGSGKMRCLNFAILAQSLLYCGTWLRRYSMALRF